MRQLYAEAFTRLVHSEAHVRPEAGFGRDALAFADSDDLAVRAAVR
jgi:hypothetical protein